jgi:hypothetical protein
MIEEKGFMEETGKLIVSVITVLVSIASFIIARRADARSKKAENIKNLLGEKESVAFAALKLLREGLPTDGTERKLIISALMQACVFEGSDRARALLYRVIEKNRDAHGKEFENALQSIQNTFDSMKTYNFPREELSLERGERRISAVRKVVNSGTHAEQVVGREGETATLL